MKQIIEKEIQKLIDADLIEPSCSSFCSPVIMVKKPDNNSRIKKKVREKSRGCHNHKPQPFPDPKRKRKPTNLNKHKPNKRTKSTKISSLFPKRGNRNTKRTEKHKNKMTHGKTNNKSPRINHKATKSKTNTGTTALERSVDYRMLNSITKNMYFHLPEMTEIIDAMGTIQLKYLLF